MPIPSSTPTPARRQLLRDTVFEKLREAILDGTLEPGERLIDEQIEHWLGVSRTPVRDAMNELERIGLVEMSPNRYTRVALPVEEEAIEALQTLGVILGGVVRLAVPRLSDVTAGEILAQLDKAVAALRSGEVLEANTNVVKFFKMLTDECGNSLLIRLCEQTIDGFAFKLRHATLGQQLDFDAQADAFVALGERIAARDAVGAELVTELIHHLPSGDA